MGEIRGIVSALQVCLSHVPPPVVVGNSSQARLPRQAHAIPPGSICVVVSRYQVLVRVL